ncbi:SET domain-containing protein [Laetiporus sulphureus 93-53]|uniref:Ribosomal lysine N-methyltransferase 4 n=1 Tax=Laetiporus sulphureus 93-53 TaxID=1314785 RepID=A0A165GWA2_9APHY|nr:SET domain-containing protein [Laetiporus sulphureus 93-53]KZT10912.1 SET domain-containing protein [Laetiporus sulphureus 93-53]
MDELVQWFYAQGGGLDESSMGLTNFAGQGRGAVALRDLPEGHTLFTIPRELTLSVRTSSLPARLGMESWKQFGLHIGWTGLILCMMWEESLGPSSRWSTYLPTLPSNFDTPMFWCEEDLRELRGTAVVDKIGKDDAERDYHEKLVPAIKSRPDLFPEELIPQNYSMERYHIMGSRILSRTFHVDPWKPENGEKGQQEERSEESDPDPHSMDVDVEPPAETHEPLIGQREEENGDIDDDDDEEEEDDEDEDGENPADVAMVPIADMLNARYGSENAKLFYEERVLRMVTIKPIKSGEQIWNTYGDPPNCDLLRRYGHVDLVDLSQPLSGKGNPADVVEVRADLVVASVSKTPASDLQDRVDWWLELTDDDTFVIMTDCELPEELASFVRLLFLANDEWEKARKKGKLPKAKVDPSTLSIVADVLERRLREYPTTIEEDEQLLVPERAGHLSTNKKHAAIVRLGEKRILDGTLRKVKDMMSVHGAQKGKDKKRGSDRHGDDAERRVKKSRR